MMKNGYFALNLKLTTLEEKTKRAFYKKFYLSYPRIHGNDDFIDGIACPWRKIEQSVHVFLNKFYDKPKIIGMNERIKTMQNTIDNNSKNPQDNGTILLRWTYGT